MFPKSSKKSFCLDRLIEDLFQYKLPSESDVRTLCKKIFSEESNIQPVPAPTTICSKSYGFFDNLLEIFRAGGHIPDTNYLFMGHFLDKGYDKIQVVSLLVALKVKHPERITLIRGLIGETWNVYGLAFQCEEKYGNQTVWKAFAEMFQYLPLSAIIKGQIFCVSGGLSPSFSTFDEIRQLDRRQEIPQDGPLTDLMWSSPSQDTPGWSLSRAGIGLSFGSDITQEFNYMNDLNLIVRAGFLIEEEVITLPMFVRELHDGQIVKLHSIAAPSCFYRE